MTTPTLVGTIENAPRAPRHVETPALDAFYASRNQSAIRFPTGPAIVDNALLLIEQDMSLSPDELVALAHEVRLALENRDAVLAWAQQYNNGIAPESWAGAASTDRPRGAAPAAAPTGVTLDAPEPTTAIEQQQLALPDGHTPLDIPSEHASALPANTQASTGPDGDIVLHVPNGQGFWHRISAGIGGTWESARDALKKVETAIGRKL